MYRLYLSVALAAILFTSLVNADGVCTGYPKMYNGKPCASTTRYFDANMGACGCGTGNTSPFSWQWTKPTAAASAPIFGTGTWCGSGCGKCYKLTPTAIGASAEGTGAPALTSLVVKVTNVCPYAGNEAWCAYDTNSHGYDAHFDLMDYNMNGIITGLGWNNPEVIYEEVDCAANGYTDWNCQCASGASSGAAATVAPTAASGNKATIAPTTAPKTATKAPTTAPKAVTKAPTTAPKAVTKAPTTAPKVATKAPTTAPMVATKAPANQATVAPAVATTAPIAATSAPIAATTAPVAATTAPVAATTAPPAAGSTTTGNVKIQVNGGSNNWWVGFSLLYPNIYAVSYVEVKDSSASATWSKAAYQGNAFWNLYSYNPSAQIVLPLSLRVTSASGNTVTAENIITSFQAATVDTGVTV